MWKVVVKIIVTAHKLLALPHSSLYPSESRNTAWHVTGIHSINICWSMRLVSSPHPPKQN